MDASTNILAVIATKLVVSPSQSFSPGYLYVDQTYGKVIYAGAGPMSPEPEVCHRVETNLAVPGFIDLHNHGMGGAPDVFGFWEQPQVTLSRALRFGVTGMLATLTVPVAATTALAPTGSCKETQETSCCQVVVDPAFEAKFDINVTVRALEPLARQVVPGCAVCYGMTRT